MAIDLDSYFARINCTAPRAATLETLRAIITAHTQSIPFENLTSLGGQSVLLDARSLQRKIIDGGRGGYCYEQNLLLKDVLEQLGFRVTGLAARVMWNHPESKVLPRSHMLLLIDIDDEAHIVDVGFGWLTLTGVLRLEPSTEQATPHERFRLLQAGAEFVMQAQVGDGWRPLYRFDLQPQAAVDYEPLNWYVSTHPQSLFVKNLLAARPALDRRYTLFNGELATHYLHGETRRQTLASVEELRCVLENEFLVHVPESRAVDEALARALRAPRSSA